MFNPYASPSPDYQHGRPQANVQGPAIALIIVSLVAIIFGVIAVIMDAVLLASGAVAELERLNDGPMSEYTQITVRTIWGVVLIIASCYVLYGAIQMRNLRNYNTARNAAIVAMIPLLGPCCIVGIPFGIWAFVTLGNPGVRSAFHEPSR